MEYSLFQFDKEDAQQDVIHHLLVADGHVPFQPEEWFRWRYEQNPSGKAIIVCANEGEKVVACAVVEKVQVECDGKIHFCGCVSNMVIGNNVKSSEVIRGLMDVTEKEAKEHGLEIIFSFRDEFDKLKCADAGWKYETMGVRYGIRQMKPFRSIFRLSDLRKAFSPNRCVAYHPDGCELIHYKVLDETNGCHLHHDMLNWLMSFTNKEYVIIDNDNVTVIAVVGHRGILKEVHLHMTISKRGNVQKRDVIDTINAKIHPDIISFIGDEHLLSERGLIKRTSQLKYGYKALKDGLNRIDEMAMAIYRWL